MTLLYEAALKTTAPESADELSSRPNNVNPTAGVTVRENYGKSVFVPDPSRPGGGVFVARSQDESREAGLLPIDIVLASEYGVDERSTSTAQPLPANAVGPEAGGGGGFAAGPGFIPGTHYPNGGGNAQSNMDGLSSGAMIQGFQMNTNATNVNPNINIDLGQIPNGMPTEDGMILNAPNQDVSLFADVRVSYFHMWVLMQVTDGGISCTMALMSLDSTLACWKDYRSVNSTGQNGM